MISRVFPAALDLDLSGLWFPGGRIEMVSPSIETYSKMPSVFNVETSNKAADLG
jgi:hypothetical protein